MYKVYFLSGLKLKFKKNKSSRSSDLKYKKECIRYFLIHREIKGLYVENTNTRRGMGLYSKFKILAGTPICQYKGKIYPFYPNSNYSVKISDHKYIDAENENCLAKFANHSLDEDPNCKLTNWCKILCLIAIRDIYPNTEIIYHYGFSRDEEKLLRRGGWTSSEQKRN